LKCPSRRSRARGENAKEQSGTAEKKKKRKNMEKSFFQSAAVRRPGPCV